MGELTYSADQIQQLLRCPVCLDRYRTPKLLPCQHTFCLSPCLEGLFERATRIIRCPECRAEHRLSSRGISGLPNNLTIISFLDLPQPSSNSTNVSPRLINESNPVSSSSRCFSCETERTLALCLHCSRQICEECRQSHVVQSQQDVGRLINQIRRSLPRLTEALAAKEQKASRIKEKCDAISSQVKESIEKLIKEIKVRETMLLSELNIFLAGEQHTIRQSMESLEIEVATATSFCDSTEAILGRSAEPESIEELVALRRQCSEHLEGIRQLSNIEPPTTLVREPRFVHDMTPVSNLISNFGNLLVSNLENAPTASQSVNSYRNTAFGDIALSHAPLIASTSRGMSEAPARRDFSHYLRRMPTHSRDNHRSTYHGHSSENRFSRNLRSERDPQLSTSRRQDRNNSDRMAGFLGMNPRFNARNAPPRNQGQRTGVSRPTWSRNPPSPAVMSTVDSDDDWADLLTLSDGRHSPTSAAQEPPPNPVRPDPTRTVASNQRSSATVNTGGTQSQAAGPVTTGGTQSQASGPVTMPATNALTTEPVAAASQPGTHTAVLPRQPVPAAVRFDIVIDESISDLTDELENTITFRYSAGNSASVSTPRNNYQQKGRSILRFGERGNGEANFTWPRGVTVHPVTNNVLIADSSNHRIQVFDDCGRFVRTIGTYGQNDGEFDCLAGIATNNEGKIIVSDRYNNRIQIFTAEGVFCSAFGTEGQEDGQFNYPWGVACDSERNIYVCDKDNHRIQVFSADGTFLRKFGQLGHRAGSFDGPNYLSVSSDNRVFVSDTGNHRIQVFSNTGEFLFTFGVQGTQRGQVKFPKGVFVDEQGFVLVADSGNNRVQVFRQDGRFYCMFGSWGSENGHFKGLEGLAVMTNGNVVVCDRENHRIQVF